jgi:quercetin dioxygenase-like cupin family protein
MGSSLNMSIVQTQRVAQLPRRLFMTSAVPIRRKPLLTAVLGGDRSIQRVEIKQVELPPGQLTGLHLHPCPVVGYVAAGAINFQIEGQPIQHLRSGDAFFEPRDARVAHFDNASASDAATFIAFYLLGTDEDRLIEMLDSGEEISNER